MIFSRRYPWYLFAALLVAARFAAAQSVGTAGESPAASAERTLAQQAIDRNDPEQAVACALRATALAPNDADCQRILGIAYGNAARQANIVRRAWLVRKSAAAFRRALALAPNDELCHQRLFEYYEHTPAIFGGGVDKAMNEAAAVKRLDPTRGAMDYASLYVGRKEYDQAREELYSVLKTSPNDVAALYQTGRIAAVSGDYLDRGLASLRLCLALSPSAEEGAPTVAEVDLCIGNILEKKGDKDGARVAYIKALSVNPKFTPAFNALKKLNG